jgi:polysaccharide export outer membrane protein
MRSAGKAVAALLLISSLGLAQDLRAQSAANSVSANSASDKAVPAQTSAASNSQGGPEYVIGPEDVLHIAVWKENDLTATLPVRPDGKISLPLLNDVQASGLTPQQLADSVTEKLKNILPIPGSPWS